MTLPALHFSFPFSFEATGMKNFRLQYLHII